MTGMILDILIFVGTTVALILDFVKPKSNGKLAGTKTFRYFTTDSNVFSALVSAVFLVAFISGQPTSEWMMALRFTSSMSVTITFLTVIFFLAPTQGAKKMFAGNYIFLHVAGPLLGIACLYINGMGRPLPGIFILYGFITVVIYGIVYSIQVLIKDKNSGGWKDFYGFNVGGRWYISFIIMGACSALVACALFFIYNLTKF